jgi:hypothetical protein
MPDDGIEAGDVGCGQDTLAGTEVVNSSDVEFKD